MQHRMQLLFKGDRDYLNGADIFNGTLAHLEQTEGPVSNVDFAFRQIAKSQLLITDMLPTNAVAVATCTYTAADMRKRVYLLETGEKPSGRYPYPEEKLVASMRIDSEEKTGILDTALDYSDIEIWVAMTKALHQHCYADQQGKWLFVRGVVPCYTKRGTGKHYQVKIMSSFGSRLTRTKVFVDCQKAGDIYFAIG